MREMINVVVCADSKVFRAYWEKFYRDNPQFTRNDYKVAFRWADSNASTFTHSCVGYLNSMYRRLKNHAKKINIIFLRRYQPMESIKQQSVVEAWRYVKFSPRSDYNQTIISDAIICREDIETELAVFNVRADDSIYF